MIKPIYVRIILCSLMVTVCLGDDGVRSQQVDNVPANKTDAGRENPFAKLPQKQKPSAHKEVSDTDAVEEQTPELFVEAATLKFFDAKNLKTAIDSMFPSTAVLPSM